MPTGVTTICALFAWVVGHYATVITGQRITVSSVLPPIPAITQSDLDDFKWQRENELFFFISSASDAEVGNIMYIPYRAVARMGIFERPFSKLLSSGNNVQYANSASNPGNPKLPLPIPASVTTIRGAGDDGATLVDERPTPSPGVSKVKDLRKLTSEDFMKPSGTYLYPEDAFEFVVRPACFYDPMATIAPTDYTLSKAVRFGTNKFEAVMRLGKDFGALTMSYAEAPPLEVVMVERDSNLRLLWPSLDTLEPAHTEPITAMKTYILGAAEGPPNKEFKIMTEVAGIADESLDHQFQASALQVSMFLFAVNMLPEDDPYLFKIVVTRMYMSAFSLVRASHRTGRVLLKDAMDLEASFKMLMHAMPYLALGGSVDSGFLDTGSPFERKNYGERALAAVVAALTSVSAIQDLDKWKTALAAAYVVGGHPVPPEAIALSMRVLNVLHEEATRGRIGKNATVSEAIFYSAALIFATRAGSEAEKAVGRRSLLLLTSMCTDERAAAADVAVQEAYLSIADRKKEFHILNVYTPCASALRTDLSDAAHRVYASMGAVSSPKIMARLMEEEALRSGGARAEERLELGAASVGVKWRATLFLTTRQFAPETYACDGSAYESAIMVLPMEHEQGAYVLGRKQLGYGISYRVDGVSVTNQLYITYMSADMTCETAMYGTITPAVLPRPGLFDGCIYCGCVLLRYEASGSVRYAIYVATETLQNELVAGENSTVKYFNPRISGNPYGATLLLFPNGTIIRVLAFDAERKTSLSITYIISAVLGLLLVVAILTVTIRMIMSYTKSSFSVPSRLRTKRSRRKPKREIIWDEEMSGDDIYTSMYSRRAKRAKTAGDTAYLLEESAAD